MYTLKINFNILLLFMIMLYPITYSTEYVLDIGPTWVNIYFLFILILMVVIRYKSRINVLFENKDLFLLGAFVLMVLIILLNTNSTRYIKPLYFSIYILVLYTLKPINIDRNIKIRSLKFLFFIYALVIIIMYNQSVNFQTLDGRFIGFSFSPTTLAVFVTALYFVANSITYKTTNKIILYVITFFIVYITKTRLNIFLFAFIPILFVLSKTKTARVWLLILAMIALNFVYPIYKYVSNNSTVLIDGRYETGKTDSSFETRIYLYEILVNDIRNSSIMKLIWGKGTEYSRILIANKIGVDLFPHNDFLRILIDFGAIFLLVFLSALLFLGSENRLTFYLVILYLLSFYHNMVYDLFLISLIIFFSKFRLNPLTQPRNEFV